ncbi:MAG: PD-(D/E)XK nuclease family protein [Paludibacteraceae bacterium]|nr:PD-(D/E)XK nuclease family protein [Paludibacteraceae bacterium]
MSYTDLQYALKASGLWQTYGRKSLLEILSECRKETAHSKFIAWLLEGSYLPEEKRSTPTIKFIELLSQRATNQNKDLCRITGSTSFSVDMLHEHKIEGINVTTEAPKDGYKIDVHVSFKLNKKTVNIYIENKVGSKERDNQTNDYYKHFNKAAVCFYAYLTPIPSYRLNDYKSLTTSETCKCDKFIHINYQDLLDEVIENIKPLINDAHYTDIINQYVGSLTLPTIYEKERHSYIMALSKNEKEEMLNIWANFEPEIRSILDEKQRQKPLKHKYHNEEWLMWEENKNILTAIVTAVIWNNRTTRDELTKLLKNIN